MAWLSSSSSLVAQEEAPTLYQERDSWLALIPVLTTGVFYLLPGSWQQKTFVQFCPQISAYLALGVWCVSNTGVVRERLWLRPKTGTRGMLWGMGTGLLLGMVNTIVILWIIPRMGGDIVFLKTTPHAQVPTFIMVPWGIALIASGVELNFRGFILGRLEQLFGHWLAGKAFPAVKRATWFAILCSAVVFALDPFMVITFRHLHWIALWDGLIWGWLLARSHNLYAVIVAHAVEVMILYVCIKAALT